MKLVWRLAIGVTAASVALAAESGTSDLFVASPLQDPQKPQQPTELIFRMTDPNFHPRVGMQDFSAAGDASLTEAAKTVAEVLWSDLDYEREYIMVPRKSSASIPVAATPAMLAFSQWSQIADVVMMGDVKASGASMTVEIRLINVSGANPGQQVFGQSYQGCTVANARYCAHSIADDIHKTQRGLDGVARTKIAFTSDREPATMSSRPVRDAGASKEIYIMDYDGANIRRITSNRSLNIAPVWGPDARTLAWASYASVYPDIYVATLDGRPATRPAHGTEVIHNQNPAISPDGRRIAFSSSRGGRPGYFDIWIVDRDGSNLRNLTNSPDSSEGAPTWSPNGNQLAFTSDRTGTNQIHLMSADGTGNTRFTFEGHADRPTWSSKNFIAYTLKQPAGHDIAVKNLTGQPPDIITDGRGSNIQPTVAPNGRHIVFVTTRWGKQHLASVDRDGKNVRQITTVGNNTYPNWSPSPGR